MSLKAVHLVQGRFTNEVSEMYSEFAEQTQPICKAELVHLVRGDKF